MTEIALTPGAPFGTPRRSMQGLEAQLGLALGGNVGAVRAIVSAFTPVIQARAARVLVRNSRAGGRGRDPRQELEDLAQDILALLFREDGRVLRAWRADGGLSLLNYVGLVAEREIGHIARSGRRSPWALDPTEETAIERAAGAVDGPEEALSSREVFDRVVARLEEELSPKGMELFRLLVVEEQSTEEVARLTGMEASALYTWRSRLLRRTRALLVEFSRTSTPEMPAVAPTPEERSDER